MWGNFGSACNMTSCVIIILPSPVNWHVTHVHHHQQHPPHPPLLPSSPSHLQVRDDPAWELPQQPVLGEVVKHHERQAEEDDDEIPEREVGQQRVGDAPHVVVVTHDAHDRHVPDDPDAEDEGGDDHHRVRAVRLRGDRIERVLHLLPSGPRVHRHERRGVGEVRHRVLLLVVTGVESERGFGLLFLRHGGGQSFPPVSVMQRLAPLLPARFCAPSLPPVVSAPPEATGASMRGLCKHFPRTASTPPRLSSLVNIRA